MAASVEVKTLEAALVASGIAYDAKKLAKDPAYFAQMHAKASAPEPTPPPAETMSEAPEGPEVDFLCGLRKVGARRYAVVVGKVVDGKVSELKCDATSQPLEFAAEEVLGAFRKLMMEIP